MARPGIQYEDVKNAAAALLERGANPSIQRIRDMLGTGSNSTIAEHLKRWQMELAGAPKITLPEAVPETLGAAVESFWAVALQQAETAYQQFRNEAEAAATAAEQGRAEATLARDQAIEKATGLAEQLASSQHEARTLADQLLIEREQRKQAETAIHAAEQREREAQQLAEQVRADAEARLAKFESLLRQAREEAEQRLQAATNQLSAERTQSEAHQQRLMQIIDQNHTEATASRKAFDDERLSWKNQETALLARLETTQAQFTASQLAAATHEERARLLEADLVQARAFVKELQEQQLIAARTTESLHTELALAQSQCNDLYKRLADAESNLSAKPLVDQKHSSE